MVWDDDVVEDFAQHLARVGLKTCPVCSTGALGVSHTSVELPWRGSPWLKAGESGYEPTANVLYMFMVVCDFCSHVMLFDSERFTPKEMPSLRPEHRVDS